MKKNINIISNLMHITLCDRKVERKIRIFSDIYAAVFMHQKCFRRELISVLTSF